MAKYTRIAALGLLAFATLGSAQDEIDLDAMEGFLSEEAELFEEAETVVTATSYARRIDRTPSNVHVITREQLDALNPKHPADALRLVPGLNVFRRTQVGHEISAFGTGWTYSNKVLVLIDGHRVSDPGFGNNYFNMIPLIPSDVHKIEVVLGPESAQYGTNAFAAVVNFITRNKRWSNEVRAEVRGGNQGHSLVSATHRHATEGTYSEVVAMSETRGSDQALQNYDTQSAFAGFDRGGEYQNKVARLKVDRRLSDRDRLYATLSGISSQVESYTGLATQNRPTNSDETSLLGTFDFDRELGERESFKLRGSYHSVRRNTSPGPAAVFGIPDTKFDTDLGQLEFRYSRPFGPWQVNSGASARLSKAISPYSDNSDPDSFATSIFAHGEREFGEKFILYAGARKDFIDYTEDPFSWKIAGLYRPQEDLGVRLSMGTSFRAPDLISFRARTINLPVPFPTSGAVLSPNPNLESETAKGFFQLGIEKEFRTSTLKFDVYRAKLEGIIDIQGQTPIFGFVAPPPFPPINTGQNASMWVNTATRNLKGASVSYERKIGVFDLTLNGNLMDTTGGTNGELPNVPYSPDWTANLLLSMPERGNWSGSLWVHAVDDYHSDATQAGINGGANPTFDSYTTVDTNVSRKVSDNSDVSFTVKNLFDQQVYEISDNLSTTGQASELYGRELFLTFRTKL